MNKAVLMLAKLGECLGKQTEDMLSAKFGDAELKTTPGKQAKYIDCILCELDEKDARAVMKKCGAEGVSESIIRKAKKIYNASEGNIEDFLEGLNMNGIGGGKLRIHNGVIHAAYSTCCSCIPKALPDINKCYCEGSVGWFERIFFECFGKPVEVKLISTILEGAKDCRFEIRY